MATSNTPSSTCSTCGKAAGTFTCRGCSKEFCLRHTIEHRQVLSRQFDENIIVAHDQLKQEIDDQMKSLSGHPFMRMIDQWEDESVKNIRQRANESRQLLQRIVNNHVEAIQRNVRQLSETLKTARDEESFFEMDLKNWMERLNELREGFKNPPMIDIQLNPRTGLLVPPIPIVQINSLTEDRFEQACGAISISDGGKLVTHHGTSTYCSARGRQEYTSGQHYLRFRIENVSTNKWLFIGILPKQTKSTGSGSIDTTAFGFSGEDRIWRNGSMSRDSNAYKMDFQANDLIQLWINCDRREIRLVQERTRGIQIIEIDPNKCPFPWRLVVGFDYCPGESIRLLV